MEPAQHVDRWRYYNYGFAHTSCAAKFDGMPFIACSTNREQAIVVRCVLVFTYTRLLVSTALFVLEK